MYRFIVLFAVFGFLLQGCGAFKSLKQKRVQTDSSSVVTAVNELREFERFSATIPVGYIKSIRLPSGTEIVLRDSVVRTQDSEARGDTLPPSVSPPEGRNSEPVVEFGYEREKDSRDSTVTDTEVKKESKVKKETEVDTGSGFTWLMIGIAVALAGVIALWIWKPF